MVVARMTRAEGVAYGPPPVRFDVDELERVAEAWNFSCGPGALCGLLEMLPEELRPHLFDFEAKGYTNPTLMFGILRKLERIGVIRGWVSSPLVSSHKAKPLDWPVFGLCRIQWAGPWTAPGVPIAARYRKTHWVASWRGPVALETMIFDINAACVGGWISLTEWSQKLVPWLLRECEPKATGEWWITHAIRVTPGD